MSGGSEWIRCSLILPEMHMWKFPKPPVSSGRELRRSWLFPSIKIPFLPAAKVPVMLILRWMTAPTPGGCRKKKIPLFVFIIRDAGDTCHQPFTPAAVPMKFISCQIDGDSVHPGFKTGISAKMIQSSECSDESILNDLFRILFGTEQSVCCPVQLGSVHNHQFIEALLFSCFERLDQLRSFHHLFFLFF